MTFRDKLARLLEDMNGSAVARRAGLTPAAIHNYLRRGTEPGVTNGLKLASALRVDARWLFDDAQDWPPVSPAEARKATVAA